MSFTALLRKARGEETVIEQPIIEEAVVEAPKKPIYIELGEAIIRTSIHSVSKYKKLKRGSNASLRIAKSLANGELKLSQFEKAWNIQKRYSSKRPDWHIVGGKAMKLLETAVKERKVDLTEALKLKIEIKE